MPIERITRHFQEELDLLKTRLLEMGGLAEERVRHSIQGLADRDFALIEAVLAGDEPVNQIHIEVDDRHRTSVLNVFAAGDIVPGPQLAIAAASDGAVAALAIHASLVPDARRID